MNVLSLFNGMSFCAMALESLNIKVDKYYSSEIDRYANQATHALYPDTIQLGNVINWREWNIDWSSIDLVTGGFPCQAWSMAGKQLGDKDERGMLFWTMLDIIKHVKYHNPNADFLIENVKMKKEFEQYITTHTENALGKVHKILINSALVSAQDRERYYWASFKVEQPKDKTLFIRDVVDFKGNYFGGGSSIDFIEKNKCHFLPNFAPESQSKRRGIKNIRGSNEKAKCLTACSYNGWAANGATNIINNNEVRTLTPRECMRLQTVPEHHINTLLSAGISNTQLYKMTGNGWTMEVIKHIFGFSLVAKGECK